MGKKIIVSILIGLGCLFILFGSVVAYIFYDASAINQTVATDVSITSEWIELASDSSIKPEKQVQEVVFVIDGYKTDFRDNSFQIKLPNGTVVNPEVQIFDENGNAYELMHSGFTNNDITFTPKTNGGFLKDRNYSKLRIRSDKPFQVSRIIWRNRNLK